VTWWRSLAVLLCALATLVSPKSASASSGLQAENRVKGFLLVAPTLVGGSRSLSLEEHPAKSNAYDENASGSCLAAEAAPEAFGEAPTIEVTGEHDVFFHYTSDPESAFSGGFYKGASVTDVGTYTAGESTFLGIPTPDKVIPIASIAAGCFSTVERCLLRVVILVVRSSGSRPS
jgi:hypothetical protein